MSFLAPAALGLLSLAIPLVALYMLRSRRMRRDVSSVRVWIGEEENVSAALPWQRLRWTAALLLQLVALLLFALLLARPFSQEATLLGPHTVAIVDTSGSMSTAGRFTSAIEDLRTVIAEASDTQLVSIVEAGRQPRVHIAFSNDPAELAAAIEQLHPGGGVADLDAAIRLARGLATPDRPTTMLLLSDGGGDAALAEPVADARHLSYDALGDNLAITALDTNPVGDGPPRLFVEVTSAASIDRTVTVAVTVDGLPAGSAPFDVAAGSSARQFLDVDAGPGQVVTAVLVDHQDANPLDDRAEVVLTDNTDIAVTVTGEGSPFLDALLGATPGIVAPVGAGPDVVIQDGGDATTVDRPSWLLAPERPPAGIEVVGRLEHPVVTMTRPGEPLLEGLDLSTLAIAEADIVQAPGWMPIVSAGDVPLILLGDVDGHRTVYFTFDVVRSNLPVQVAFPVLGARLIDWLAGTRISATGVADAGTPIPLAAPAGTSAMITDPDGVTHDVAPATVEYTATDAPGVYRIDYVDAEDNVVSSTSAARRFAAVEVSAVPRRIAVSEPVGAADEGALVREWAPMIIALLLALVMLEWWVAFGRPLPGRRRSTSVHRRRGALT